MTEHGSQSTGALSAAEFDLLVIGGGIVGAGVARDAAMRGLQVALVEQHDFASGTSSRSSRLLHGGIRYLAQGRVGLVREASREKTILHKIAPHLSDPLPFIFPTRRGSQWSRWKLGIGVKIYDLLCGNHNLGKSRGLNVAQTLDKLPGLNTERLTGAVRYFDGFTNDARLVIDTLRSAADHGAAMFNYVCFEGAEPANNGWRCELRDARENTKLELSARCVVNATGPWSDRLPLSEATLRPTKGVHLVIDRERLPVPDAVVMAEGDRILFAIPWGERVILGTTDTDYDGPLDSPPCDAADVDYILNVTNEWFPESYLTTDDIVSTWAGLRPLVADKRGNPSDISRRHDISMSHPGWWDVTGGKLTTYRLMAEETIDAIVRYLNVAIEPCRTADAPLQSNGAAKTFSGVLPPEVARDVVDACCRAEWAVHLDDVMIRRTSWRHFHRDQFEIAERVAAWMGEILAWDDGQIAAELSRYRSIIADASPTLSI